MGFGAEKVALYIGAVPQHLSIAVGVQNIRHIQQGQGGQSLQARHAVEEKAPGPLGQMVKHPQDNLGTGDDPALLPVQYAPTNAVTFPVTGAGLQAGVDDLCAPWIEGQSMPDLPAFPKQALDIGQMASIQFVEKVLGTDAVQVKDQIRMGCAGTHTADGKNCRDAEQRPLVHGNLQLLEYVSVCFRWASSGLLISRPGSTPAAVSP